MRKEWQEYTSWNARRMIGVATAMAVALFAAGLALARLTTPGALANEAATAALDPPRTEIGEAVTETRTGEHTPAPVDDLVVVRLSVNVCGIRSVGSGVVIGDGLLLTAAHVVGNASLVRIDHGGVTVTGEVIGVLADGRDIALVAVDAPGVAELPLARVPALGDPITVVGYAEGDPRRSVAVGPRVEVAEVVESLIAPGTIGVDAVTSRGFSGGPAVDANGGLVGIVVAMEAETETALVVPLLDLGRIDETAVVEGRCTADA